MLKAYALVRVSTNMQETEQQVLDIKTYADKNKILIKKFIEEFDVSGFSTPIHKRHGLNEILDLVYEKEIDVLLVQDLSRIGRKTELIGFINTLLENNVKIISMVEGEISNDHNSKLMNVVKMWMNEGYSIQLSHKSKAGLKAKNESGAWAGGTVNYGYKYDRNTGILSIDEDEAKVVKEIFNLYLENGANTIADMLNDRGIKKRGYTWKPTTITKLINCKIYIGYKEYNYRKNTQDFNKDYVIIEEEIFDKAQELRKQRNTRGYGTKQFQRENLFAGLIQHWCGKNMHFDAYTNGRKDRYKCHYCKLNKTEDTKKSIAQFKIEEYVINDLIEKSIEFEKHKEEAKKILTNKLTGDNSEKIKEVNNEIKKQKAVISRAEIEIEKIFTGESTADFELMNKMVKNAKLKIDELKSIRFVDNTKKLERALEMLDTICNLKDMLDNADEKHRKKIFIELIDKITVDKNNNISVKYNIEFV